MDDITVLLPLRDPGTGKSRLAPELSPGERADLSRAMATDVVAALRAAGVGRLVALVDGARAAEEAARLGLRSVADPPDADLNRAVARATAEVTGPGAAVVMADLPRLTPTDVEALLAIEATVVVAPTDDGGTGALVRRPPLAIATAYGHGSAQRHLTLARLAGMRAATHRSTGFAHDVDTVADLRALRDGAVGDATREVLAGLRVPRR